MFKKNEIKKALTAICLHNDVRNKILAAKDDAEQSDIHFLKGYAVKLYTDELMEYLNDESVAELKNIETFDKSDLGLLGKCPMVEAYLNSNVYGKKERQERVCCAGRYRILAPQTVTDNEQGSEFTTLVEGVTYITENGDILLVREISYVADNVPILVIRMPDACVEPSVANLIDLFPEDCRDFWEMREICENDESAEDEELHEAPYGVE